ncbi:hypothetical protein niasHS_015591 [Heterodera schachtii]|uniref:Caspase family p10 domain-containing protein n=1 Tax=Heterodera schachtii TaxID=97005 RepID=A0ABD2HXW3_HETSC
MTKSTALTIAALTRASSLPCWMGTSAQHLKTNRNCVRASVSWLSGDARWTNAQRRTIQQQCHHRQAQHFQTKWPIETKEQSQKRQAEHIRKTWPLEIEGQSQKRQEEHIQTRRNEAVGPVLEQLRPPTMKTNFLIAHATFAHFVSWRHHKYGTYFVQSLVEVLSKRACQEDILNMMTRVNDLVGKLCAGPPDHQTQTPVVEFNFSDFGLPSLDMSQPRLKYTGLRVFWLTQILQYYLFQEALESVQRIFSLDHDERSDFTAAFKKSSDISCFFGTFWLDGCQCFLHGIGKLPGKWKTVVINKNGIFEACLLQLALVNSVYLLDLDALQGAIIKLGYQFGDDFAMLRARLPACVGLYRPQGIVCIGQLVDEYPQQEFQFQTFVNSRGWQGIRDSMYFMKAGVEAIIEDEVTSRFKVNAPIYPIAMKYDSRFGDAFWNSSEQSYFRYLLQMMTSWALICHVWYWPPMTKEQNKLLIMGRKALKRKESKRRKHTKHGRRMPLNQRHGLRRRPEQQFHLCARWEFEELIVRVRSAMKRGKRPKIDSLQLWRCAVEERTAPDNRGAMPQSTSRAHPNNVTNRNCWTGT